MLQKLDIVVIMVRDFDLIHCLINYYILETLCLFPQGKIQKREASMWNLLHKISLHQVTFFKGPSRICFSRLYFTCGQRLN
jgi:hypothetical protein